MHEDDVELRSRIEETTEAALNLADELATTTDPVRRAKLAADYTQLRTLLRSLRRSLVAVIAG